VRQQVDRAARLARHAGRVATRLTGRIVRVREARAEMQREWARQRTAYRDAVARWAAGPDEEVVAVDGRRLVGSRRAYRAPAEHRLGLLRLALDAFEAQGLSAFVLPHPTRLPRTVAVVAAADDPALGRAVTQLATEAGLFVAALDSRLPGGVAVPQREVLAQSVFRLFAVVAGDGFAYGPGLGIDVECWLTDEQDRAWLPARKNAFVERVLPEEQELAPLATVVGELPTLRTMSVPSITDVDFPVDVVYTWVDGSDEAWQRSRAAALRVSDPEQFTELATAEARFRQHDELRYSLRSLERHAPWVNHIWVVTADQVPEWLDTDHPKVTVVSHQDIWSAEGTLPTFNSHAIEAHLHRIEGLTEHFVYLNDDVFFGQDCAPEMFFEANGIQRLFQSGALVPDGDPQPGEIASESAGKNARTVIEDLVGRRIRTKLFHAPFALRRSVSEEIAARYPTEVQETARSVFRRMGDVTLSGALHMYYSLATGRAVTSGLHYRYVNVDSPAADARLRALTRTPFAVFCLNDTGAHDTDPRIVDLRTRGFLASYFPNRSSFER
jgi:Stealth protein CR2, conserved region 2/Stealth protein CR1, conserved region 1/Stealth protein CR3, conserved region 3/Stealth protein CR4, conserved region 4